MNENVPIWNEITQLLTQARRCLPADSGQRDSEAPSVGVLTGTLPEFDEFLAHNELELAWDALAGAAERLGAPAACWRNLAQAAKTMQLPVKEKFAQDRSGPRITYDEALAIAGLDAEKVCNDVTLFRITLALEPDGWHIDFEPKDPRLHGAGPRYVIDPATGTIVHKQFVEISKEVGN